MRETRADEQPDTLPRCPYCEVRVDPVQLQRVDGRVLELQAYHQPHCPLARPSVVSLT